MFNREAEIRRKINQLRREGRLKRNDLEDDDDGDYDVEKSDASDYTDRIRQKLGDTRSKLLGFDKEDDIETETSAEITNASERARIGALPKTSTEETSSSSSYIKPSESKSSNWIDPSLFDSEEDGIEDEEELKDEELLEVVAAKMMEKNRLEQLEKDRQFQEQVRAKRKQLEEENKRKAKELDQKVEQHAKTTSGVGGSWAKNKTAVTKDIYQPKTGSWGAFPRPRDISKAYGGGRRVGPGYSNEEAREKSEQATRDRLKAYREKVGIEVPSEKEHAAEIEEALSIGTLAMQRGMYSTAVSALEKVTKYCSTNSKVGGKVFLELAMAYEAAGRTEEAIEVYRTLSKCRMEDIKFNAKKLLYGIEAMQFMRNEVKSSAFSRKRAKNTFMDTTGMNNFVESFDDRYNMAYLDLSKGDYYKALTEAVVRSPREARQILLKAVDKGEVTRLRIVQALRSVSRGFDDALVEEIEQSKVVEPVAVMNGKPILERRVDTGTTLKGMEEFTLAPPEQMRENLDGEWRLQCLADKKGDGVTFFNTTVAWQRIDTTEMVFSASSPVGGLVTVQQTGGMSFNDKRRILRRKRVQVTGGGLLTGLLGGMSSGVPASVALPQQVLTVDSMLLITRGVPSRRVRNGDDTKNYFAVWRKVEPGTYSAA